LIVIQYIIGFILCVLVAFIYSSTRKNSPREIVRDGVVVLAWMLAALVMLGVFGYVGSHYM
jgi:nucleoside permease NupC